MDARATFALDSNPLAMRPASNFFAFTALCLSAFVLFPSLTSAQDVFINEVDADSNTVPDSLEFVELFGEPNLALDGHIVVFYKGGGNLITTNVYAAFDLDGHQLDSAGFFVLGNPQIGASDVVFEPGLLRDGGDAVALFAGDSADFPIGTPLTTPWSTAPRTRPTPS